MKGHSVLVLILALINFSFASDQLEERVGLSSRHCPGRPAYICNVVLPSFCQNGNGCPADPVLVFPGVDSTAYGFDNFNALSFDSFSAPSGDVEGRAAVRNTMNVNAFSVGYMLNYIEDIYVPYALVIGHDGTFNYGSVHPQDERIYAGDSFTSQEYLTDRADVTGISLDNEFDSAQYFYGLLSAEFANVVPDATVYFEWGALGLNCSDYSATSYTVAVDSSDFSVINAYTTFYNCNPYAQYVFNIYGTGDVIFTGNYILREPENVLYNILGTGRTIIGRTAVRGSILSPYNNFYQENGVVIGLVIVGNMQKVHQINKPKCNHHNPIPEINCSSTTFTPPQTTRAVTSQALTSNSVTSQALTSQALTTQAITSQALTTQPLTTQFVTSQPLTTQALTTQELTTEPLTTQPLTTQPITSQALTTQPLTTSPLTTQPLTTQALTTQPLTTQALTTQPLTSSPLTTQPLTTSPLTTQPLSTQALTTQSLTTSPLTTQPLTTQALTTRALTTRRGASKK